MTTITNSAFTDCTKLTSVTIPSSVTKIMYNAFGDTGLTEITCLATTPPECLSLYSQFMSVNKNNVVLYVPSGSVNAYKTANVWKAFTNIQAIS